MKKKNDKTVRSIAALAAFTAVFFGLNAWAQEPLPVPAELDSNAAAPAQPAERELQIPEVFRSDEAPSVRLAGDWPDNVRKISVAATDKPIADILQDISKQLGYGLVLKASDQTAAKKMTLRLVRKPANEVLEIVLEAGDLTALLKGDVLFVGPAVPAPQASPSQPAAPAQPTDLAAQTEPPFKAVVPIPGIPGISASATVSADDDDDDNDKSIKIRRRLGTRHERNRIQVGKPVHVKVDEEVDDAVAIGGALLIEGKVNGDAVAVGGPLTVEPTAEVRGDTVAVGGPLDVKEGAKVYGERVGIGIPIPIGSILSDMENGEVGLGLPAAASGVAGTVAAFSFLGFLLKSVLLFVLALVVVLLAPKRVERIRGYLVDHTGKSILAGTVMLLSFVPLIILLAVTIIGLPLIPVAIVALMVLMVVGLAAIVTWVGYRIPLFESKKNQLIAMTIGVVLIMLINLIPVVGPIVLFLASFVAAGAALLSRFGSEPKDSIAPPPPPAPAESAVPGASE